MGIEQGSSVEGIVFDLDGTLIDSLVDLHLSVNHTLKLMGYPERTKEDVRSYIGHGADDLFWKAMGRPQDRTPIREALLLFTEYYSEHSMDHTGLYDGVLEMIQTLHESHRLFVLSNKPASFTKSIVTDLKLTDYFQEVIGGGDLPELKPNPLPLQHISRKYSIALESLLMVGDGDPDIQCARNAGVRSIFCSYGMGKLENSIPDATINSIRQLPEFL